MKDTELVQFVNCKILRDHEIITEDLWVRSGKIVNPEKVFFDEKVEASKKIDCQGCIIAPGFIELQINGIYDSLVMWVVDELNFFRWFWTWFFFQCW